MGVRSLYTFMKRDCPNGVREINMENEIKKFKMKENIDKPVIVIDIVAIHKFVYTSTKEKLMGGRYNIYNDRMEKVFRTLVNLGVELICIDDGPLCENKVPTTIKRRNEKYWNEWEILEEIESGLNLNHPNIEKYADVNLTPFFPNLRSIAKKYCTIIISTREADQEIVYQANQRNALAIISHDTDFLIFDGKWEFWSANDLNLEHLKILQFNKAALRSHLTLSPLQMILLASIAGNDFVKYEMVEPFLNKIYARNNKFEKLSDIVRRLSTIPPHISEKDEQYLINLIFLPESKNIGRNDLRTSINFYINVHSPTIFPTPLLKRVSQNSFVYSVLADKPMLLSTFFTNLDKKDFIPYYSLIKSIVQKQFGTLLKNESEPMSLTRRVYTKLEHHQPYRSIDEIPVFPEENLPSVEELVFQPYGANKKLDELRIRLFCWYFSPSSIITPDKISQLSSEWVVPVTIIAFLLQKRQINIDEADCLLYACVCDRDFHQYANLNQFSRINGRDARICFLFTRLFAVIGRSVTILGLSNMPCLITFDGIFYHFLRANWHNKKALISNLESKYNYLRIYNI